MAYDRQFIDCIDADEVIEVAGDSRPTVLRCTLFLFSDMLLIAKRPSGEKSGKTHVGLDDADKLLDLFQTSHLPASQANLLGSPKKLRRGVLGFRGLVDLATIAAVDLGPSEFGLVFDHPPTDQSERWCDRPARKYVVANTVQPDVKRAEKDVWLNRFGETILHGKLRLGAKLAKKSKRIWDDGGASDSTEVYWSVWDRKTWDALHGSQKVGVHITRLLDASDLLILVLTSQGKLALHLDEIGNSTVLARNGGSRPQTVAHAVFLRDGGCRHVCSLSARLLLQSRATELNPLYLSCPGSRSCRTTCRPNLQRRSRLTASLPPSPRSGSRLVSTPFPRCVLSRRARCALDLDRARGSSAPLSTSLEAEEASGEATRSRVKARASRRLRS